MKRYRRRLTTLPLDAAPLGALELTLPLFVYFVYWTNFVLYNLSREETVPTESLRTTSWVAVLFVVALSVKLVGMNPPGLRPWIPRVGTAGALAVALVLAFALRLHGPLAFFF